MERCIENLYIWNESRKVVNMIYAIMQNCRDYGFRDQIQRASVSIMNNIAEGSESGTDANFVKFLNIAKGSCAEVRSMLYLMEDLFQIEQNRISIMLNSVERIGSNIYNLIVYLNTNNNKL